MYMLQQRLKYIKSKLKAWNKKEFGDILKARIETEKKLQEINQINITEGFNEEKQKLTNSLQEEWEDYNRKISGDKNPRFNGSKREKEILSSSTNPLWPIGHIIE